jgi:DNA topoisomerase VI subunit B
VNSKLEDNHVNCKFEVSDTGIGISEEGLGRIFNKFEQASSLIARTYGGTGLGLSIVKLLVEAQGGSLNVSSDPGLGSTFSVALKFENSPVSQREGNAVKKPVSKQLAKKVIVVDDDAMILRLCGLILEANKIPLLRIMIR